VRPSGADIPVEMTSIRTNCPRCGEVEMRADVIVLTVEDRSGEGSYSFVCPSCLDLVKKSADRKIVGLLRSVGVDVAERPSAEAEAEAEAESRPDGPPFTVDDLIDFHYLLDGDDWFAALASAE
jgi:predicted RNA-binding Zn-ribbon protein involved in translation (DUF1610 family)